MGKKKEKKRQAQRTHGDEKEKIDCTEENACTDRICFCHDLKFEDKIYPAEKPCTELLPTAIDEVKGIQAQFLYPHRSKHVYIVVL